MKDKRQKHKKSIAGSGQVEPLVSLGKPSNTEIHFVPVRIKCLEGYCG